jgi:hypothetical protein
MQNIPKNIVRLLDYWNSLAGGEPPERDQFLIEDIAPLLPYLLICDFEFNPFRVRYRLSGTRVDEMTGINLTGRYLDEFVEGDYADSVREMLGYYEEASRTGRSRIWTYPWAGNNPNGKVIWVGVFPLKVNGVISKCVSIEDYGSFRMLDDGRIAPVDPLLRADWAKLDRR